MTAVLVILGLVLAALCLVVFCSVVQNEDVTGPKVTEEVGETSVRDGAFRPLEDQ